MLYEKGLFDNYDNANDVLEDYLLSEVNEGRISDFDPKNHVVIQ